MTITVQFLITCKTNMSIKDDSAHIKADIGANIAAVLSKYLDESVGFLIERTVPIPEETT